jgi:site-specific DNA recombinase
MRPRAAIYVRVSGPGDTRVASLDTQAEDTRAKLSGYEVQDADIYVERYTGKLLHERPELSRLRELIRSGHYQALAVYCLDRLSRDPTHLAVLWDECEVHNCQILSATEDVDSSPEGTLIRNIRGYASQVERLKIIDRTQRGVKTILESGQLLCNGKARYGYSTMSRPAPASYWNQRRRSCGASFRWRQRISA